MPPRALGPLVRIMTFNLLIGDAYAHGKNLSLLHDRLGTTLLEDLDSIAIEDIAADKPLIAADRCVARKARELIAMVLEAANADTVFSDIGISCAPARRCISASGPTRRAGSRDAAPGASRSHSHRQLYSPPRSRAPSACLPSIGRQCDSLWTSARPDTRAASTHICPRPRGC